MVGLCAGGDFFGLAAAATAGGAVFLPLVPTFGVGTLFTAPWGGNAFHRSLLGEPFCYSAAGMSFNWRNLRSALVGFSSTLGFLGTWLDSVALFLFLPRASRVCPIM